MKNIKMFVVVFAILIILFFIIIYTRDTKHITPMTNKTKTETLTIWVQSSFLGEEVYLDDLKQAFSEKNEDIIPEITIISGNDKQVYNHINERILNGQEPDVLMLSYANYNSMATEGKLYSLDDYLNTYDDFYFIPSATNYGYYNNVLYGIAYRIDPEICVLKKSYLSNHYVSQLQSSKDTGEFISNLINIQRLYGNDAFSVPALTSQGHFIASVLSKEQSQIGANRIFDEVIGDINNLKAINYDYNKYSTHPFFESDSALSIEPLSLLYEYIDNDYTYKDQISILPIYNDGITLSYSTNSYASIYCDSDQKEEAELFLNSYFSEQEIYNRYYFYNIPIICFPLKESFINDKRYDNEYIWSYLINAFHYPIDANTINDLKRLDKRYEAAIRPK